jgi:hypothetical protein
MGNIRDKIFWFYRIPQFLVRFRQSVQSGLKVHVLWFSAYSNHEKLKWHFHMEPLLIDTPEMNAAA